MKVTTKNTVFELVWLLVKDILACSDEEVGEIATKRLARMEMRSDFDDIVMDEEVGQHIDPNDTVQLKNTSRKC